MAAAYATGTFTSPVNLLQTFVSWLVAQGYVVDLSAADGSGWRAHLHKGPGAVAKYINMRAAMSEQIWPADPTGFHDKTGGYGIGAYLGTGYSGAVGWAAQVGGPLRVEGTTIGAGMNLPAGSGAGYYFFDDGQDNIAVFVERAPGIFCHLYWGRRMAGSGLPEDFQYFGASSSAYRNTDSSALGVDRAGINVTAWPPMSHGDVDPRSESSGPSGSYVHSTAFVRVDAATFSGRWIGNGTKDSETFGYTGRFMRCALNKNPTTIATGECEEGAFPGYQYMLQRAHQSAYAGALLLPLHCYVRTDPGGRYASVGYPYSLYWCEAVGNGYQAKDIYSVGGYDYMLFPGFAVWKAA